MHVLRADRSAKPYIAIAIGNERLRAQATACLMSFYSFAEYPDTASAIAGCHAQPPSLVLVGEELPAAGGFDLVHKLRRDAKLAVIPVVMMVARGNNGTLDAITQCGAERYLVNPYSRSALITTISDLLNRTVERGWKQLPPLQRQALTGTLEMFNGISNIIGKGEPILYRNVSDACRPLVDAVANHDFKGILDGVKDHDNYSYAHSVRVATYLSLFGSTLRLPKDEQVVLASGGLLHDVGKMSIPHEVLNKPGRLTTEEFAVMKGHVASSVQYLRGCPGLPKGIITIAEQHHEKLDGTGYPNGLAGKQLDRLARMASIIDVFIALTDRRVYRPPMEAETALTLMVDQMGSHLDMALLGLFRQMLLDATTNTPVAA
jgi:putative nucleotidyltransferase with HDIG domain